MQRLRRTAVLPVFLSLQVHCFTLCRCPYIMVFKTRCRITLRDCSSRAFGCCHIVLRPTVNLNDVVGRADRQIGKYCFFLGSQLEHTVGQCFVCCLAIGCHARICISRLIRQIDVYRKGEGFLGVQRCPNHLLFDC